MPRRPGTPTEELDEKRPVATANVDDGLVSAPVGGGQALDPSLPTLLHGTVERGALLRMLREPIPEIGPEEPWERRLARGVELAGGAVPDAAEEMGEVVPAAAASKNLRRFRVLEHTRLGLGEDPVACQRAQQPLEGVRIRAGLAGELRDGFRTVRERVRDSEISDDRKSPRGERAAQEVPNLRLGSEPSSRGSNHGRDLIHLRIRERAAVEQQTSVADDADHRRVAGAERRGELLPTAHAKLGSSASGNAPPPTRPTVSSMSPSTRPASRSARARTAASGSTSIRSTGTSRHARLGSR